MENIYSEWEWGESITIIKEETSVTVNPIDIPEEKWDSFFNQSFKKLEDSVLSQCPLSHMPYSSQYSDPQKD
jgi:hypothetical protein